MTDRELLMKIRYDCTQIQSHVTELIRRADARQPEAKPERPVCPECFCAGTHTMDCTQRPAITFQQEVDKNAIAENMEQAAAILERLKTL